MNTPYKDEGVRMRMGRNMKERRKVWGEGDDRLSPATICPFDTLTSPSIIKNESVTLCGVPDHFIYSSTWWDLDATSWYISVKNQPLLPCITAVPFSMSILFFSSLFDIRCFHAQLPLSPFLLISYIDSFVCIKLWYTVNIVTRLNFLPSLQTPQMLLLFLLGLPTPETGWYRRRAVKHCGFLHV